MFHDSWVIFLHAVSGVGFVLTCSSIYLDGDDADDEYERIESKILLTYSNPRTFQYLKDNDGDEFVLSYSYMKKTPVWAYERLTADMLSDETRKEKVVLDNRIKHEAFLPSLDDALRLEKDGDYELLPLIPYENHKKGRKNLLKHSNHVLVKMTDHEKMVWNEINKFIRDLAKQRSAKVKNLQVCTGVLFRTINEKSEHKRIRNSEAGFYKLEPLKGTERCRKSSDSMEYKIAAGFSVPDALYKVFKYDQGGKTYLSMFVVPTNERENIRTGNTETHNYFWSSLHELERHAGVFIFQNELKRFITEYRTRVEKQCQMTEQSLTKKIRDLELIHEYNSEAFVQAVCEITNTNSPRKGKKPADKTIKRENYELRLADHTVQVFTNFIANFNHKNLVSDWVIEYMDRERYKRIVESDIGREDNDMTFVLTEAMTMPFDPTTACYLDKNSKYDRGHLAPALFHKEEEDTYKETFTMMNVAPQFDRFNRHVWANLEKVILSDFRNSEYEKMYIMTGPLYILCDFFSPRHDRTMEYTMKYNLLSNSGIAVPTHFFKVVLFINDLKGLEDMKIVQLENKQYKEDEEVRLRNLKNLKDFPSTSTYDLERQVGYEIFPKSRWMLGVHRDRVNRHCKKRPESKSCSKCVIS